MKTADEVLIALHDNDYDVDRTVEFLFDGGDVTEDWQTVGGGGSRKKQQQSPSQEDAKGNHLILMMTIHSLKQQLIKITIYLKKGQNGKNRPKRDLGKKENNQTSGGGGGRAQKQPGGMTTGDRQNRGGVARTGRRSGNNETTSGDAAVNRDSPFEAANNLGEKLAGIHFNETSNGGENHHDGANQDEAGADHDRMRNGNGRRMMNNRTGPNGNKPRPNSGVYNNQTSGGSGSGSNGAGGYKDRNLNRNNTDKR